MNNIRCRFGYTEKSCVEKDYPPCGDGDCELPDKPIPQKHLHKFNR